MHSWSIARPPAARSVSGRRTSDAQKDERYDSDTTQAYNPAYQFDSSGSTDRPSASSVQLVTPSIKNIWSPGETNNSTVHLDMEVREDLDQEIEHFCRLYKSGSFTSARLFFEKNLLVHSSKPYVFVIYAEMLFRQGSYHDICNLKNAPRILPNLARENIYARMLKDYWQLILAVAQVRSLRPAPGLQLKIDSLSDDLRQLIMKNPDHIIGSLEIGMICLLAEARDSPWAKAKVPKLLPFLHDEKDSLLKTIYDQLLMGGRIWDLHDLLDTLWRCGDFVGSMHEVTGCSYPRALSRLINDWTASGTQDVSTDLALLDLLMTKALISLGKHHLDEVDEILEYATPRVISLSKIDKGQLKSKGYIKWMVTKACCSAMRNASLPDCRKHLQSSTGIASVEGPLLPQYIPLSPDNPGWQRLEVSSTITKAVTLAVNTAKDLGDHATAALALEYLAMITADPVSEFEDLKSLQLKANNMFCYMDSLVSSYLVADSDDAKSKLKKDLADQIFRPQFESMWPPDRKWMANMMFYVLEKEGPQAEQALEAADNCAQLVSDSLMHEIEDKIPRFLDSLNRRRAARHNGGQVDDLYAEPMKLTKDKTSNKSISVGIDSNRKISEEKSEQLASIGENFGLTEKYRLPYDVALLVQPPFCDRKKLTLVVEDIDDETKKEEIVYQPEGPEQPAPLTENREPGVETPKPPAIILKPRNSGGGFESHELCIPQ